MTDFQLAKLEGKYIAVDSDFHNTHYLVDKNRGIVIATDNGNLAIAGENIRAFLDEVATVWDLHGVR